MHPADFLKQVWPASIPAAQYVTALQIVEAMAKKADPPAAEAPPIAVKRQAKPKMKRRIDEQQAAITKLQVSGNYTAKGLARALGLSLKTIRLRLRERGAQPIKPRKRVNRASETSKIWDALMTGPATTREIADATGLDGLFVSSRLSEWFRQGRVERVRVSDDPLSYRYSASTRKQLARIA